jgi:SpoVK/Ycf46/Vps4 family AAA+-type ATPase
MVALEGKIEDHPYEDDAIRVPPLASRAIGLDPVRPRTQKGTRKQAAAVRAFLKQAGGELLRVPAPPSPVGRNLGILSAALGLEPTELAVLQFVLAVHSHRAFQNVITNLPCAGKATSDDLVAFAIANPRPDVSRALAPASRLVGSGLVTVKPEHESIEERLCPDARLVDLVLEQHVDRERILSAFLSLASPPTLTELDFSHLSEQVATARSLLAAALEAHRSGINVFLYGPTGVGKTELARLLARDLGVKLHLAGATDGRGRSPDAQERLASLLVGHRLLAQTRALVLFDEMEDLFEAAMSELFMPRLAARMSKLWFNRLLEENPVPTLWITNDAGRVDPAFLRRFTFSIEFRPLGEMQRQRVLARHAGGENGLAPHALESLAGRYEVSAAEIATAAQAARLVGGGSVEGATMDRFLRAALRLGGRRKPAPQRASAEGSYRLDALRASVDLSSLVERLATFTPGDGPGLSLCLHGPPGTGKTELVYHLAARMGRRVLTKRVSDLESCWVGATEANIARAFDEAEAEDAILLLDEADTFLRDRRGALMQWELSMTNELLQQLEAFRGLVACTTNLMDELDEALLRRFAVKVEFFHASKEGALALFDALLAPLLVAPLDGTERALVAERLAPLTRLGPGDFAVVARRVRLLGSTPTAHDLVAALEAEVAAKRGPSRAVGFQRGHGV